jgi:hypothetical protein
MGWTGVVQMEHGEVILWRDRDARFYRFYDYENFTGRKKKELAPRIKQEVAPIAEVVAAVLDKTGNGVKDWYSPGFLKSLKEKT